MMIPFDSIATSPCFNVSCVVHENQDAPILYDVNTLEEANFSVVNASYPIDIDTFPLQTEPITCQSVLPDAGFSAVTTYCAQDTFRLDTSTVFSLGTSVWLSALWPEDTIVGKDPSFPVLTQKGDYAIKHLLYAGGCLYEDSVKVEIRQPSLKLTGDTIVCPNDTTWLTASVEDSVMLQWDNASSDSLLPVISEGTYHVLATDSMGCTHRDSIIINNPGTPLVQLPPDVTVCQADSFWIVPAAINGQITWDDQSQDSALIVKQSGLFFAQAQNACGTDSDTIQVTFPIIKPSVTIQGYSALCIHDTLLLSAQANDSVYTYRWNTSAVTSEITVTEPGQYVVSVEDTIGCAAMDSLFVEQGVEPQILLPPDQSICDIKSFEIVPELSVGQISWPDSSISASFIVTESGTYTAQASNECGLVSDSIQVEFKNCQVHVDVPTAFSPNHDAYNDELVVFAQNATVLEMYIYDRWGNMVYAHKGANPNWDGFFNGKLANIGVYAYIIKYRNDLTGKEEFLTGDTTLIH